MLRATLFVAMIAFWVAPPQVASAAPSGLSIALAAEQTGVEVEPGATFRDCDECPEMVVVPAGDFMMGSPASEQGRFDEEGPQRRVHIRKLAVGKFHVTRGQWAAFVSATNRSTTGGCAWSGVQGTTEDGPNESASWRNLGFAQDDAHPVVCITWQDALAYVHWLGIRSGHGYRLLTEAEWEYSARAGSTTPYPWGPDASHEHANYGADACCSGIASGLDRWVNTSPVGSFPPNAFGLYDMHGNVMQWVQDCFANSYAGLPIDGSAYETAIALSVLGDLSILNGTLSCSYRMLRGGNWGDPPDMIRSAARNFAPPPGAMLQNYSSAGLGLRVARAFD
jgi:formylglycine-generating enzyme required for sulfatase activity